MHEMGIALKIVESAVASIPTELADRPVERITLDIGTMSGIVEDSLRFCFEVASKGTVLETAELVINEIPVMARCLSCPSEWEIRETNYQCPSCGSQDIRLQGGRELLIRSMDIHDTP
jgi:hydrogenase nickel incorporation protein HypA/HybF